MSLVSITSVNILNNSKLFFSKKEITKIFSCYSLGVSKGHWKDYAMNFCKNEASFAIYKHTGTVPNYVLTKYKKSKKSKIFYKLKDDRNDKKNSDKIEDLIVYLKRKNINIV